MNRGQTRQRPVNSRRNVESVSQTSTTNSTNHLQDPILLVFLLILVILLAGLVGSVIYIFSDLKTATTVKSDHNLTPKATTHNKKPKNGNCGLYRNDKLNLSGDFSKTYSLEDFPFIVGLRSLNGLECHGVFISRKYRIVDK